MQYHYRFAFDHFNPRSPRGGATVPIFDIEVTAQISIHAPHEGERHDIRARGLRPAEFQSTLPTRGSDSQYGDYVTCSDVLISIHAPHEGERPSLHGTVCACSIFQSTLPARGSDTKRGLNHLR